MTREETIREAFRILRLERRDAVRGGPIRIYGLFDVGELFYVGLTRYSLKERLDAHVGASISGSPHPVCERLREMAAAGRLVEIRLIEDNAGLAAEELWIKALLYEGHRLVNVNKTLPRRWPFLA